MTDIKWFDYRGHSDAQFQFYIGPRGIGKTYSVMDEIYKTAQRERGLHKWLYMRLSEIEIKSSCGVGNAFKDYNLDHGTDIEMEYSDKVSEIHLYEPYKSKEIEYTDTLIGYCKSLETFSNLRGVSFADVDWIFFDEFIPQITSRSKPIYKIAGQVFDNAYETINRNRELKGRPPVKCYFFGNSNTTSADILANYGLLEVLSRMLKSGQKKYSDRKRSIYLELCSAEDVTNRKRDTALYNLQGDSEYTAMALDNAFPKQEFRFIQNVPIAEYNPIVQFDKYSIWKHKSSELWHCRKSDSTAKTRYSKDDETLFFRNHNVDFVCLLLEKKITFDSVETKNVMMNTVGKNMK